jgi:hypothetical protein
LASLDPVEQVLGTGSSYQPVEKRMVAALERLASLAGATNIAERDPTCPLSFSLISDEHAAHNMEKIYSYAKDQAIAFTPLRPDGWPKRW